VLQCVAVCQSHRTEGIACVCVSRHEAAVCDASVLRCVAVCCSVLQCVALCGSVMRFVAVSDACRCVADAKM